MDRGTEENYHPRYKQEMRLEGWIKATEDFTIHVKEPGNYLVTIISL